MSDTIVDFNAVLKRIETYFNYFAQVKTIPGPRANDLKFMRRIILLTLSQLYPENNSNQIRLDDRFKSFYSTILNIIDILQQQNTPQSQTLKRIFDPFDACIAAMLNQIYNSHVKAPNGFPVAPRPVENRYTPPDLNKFRFDEIVITNFK